MRLVVVIVPTETFTNKERLVEGLTKVRVIPNRIISVLTARHTSLHLYDITGLLSNMQQDMSLQQLLSWLLCVCLVHLAFYPAMFTCAKGKVTCAHTSSTWEDFNVAVCISIIDIWVYEHSFIVS